MYLHNLIRRRKIILSAAEKSVYPTLNFRTHKAKQLRVGIVQLSWIWRPYCMCGLCNEMLQYCCVVAIQFCVRLSDIYILMHAQCVWSSKKINRWQHCSTNADDFKTL